MKPDPRQEADRWLRQAEYELGVGERLVNAGDAAPACFFAQQAAEKALKALSYYWQGRAARGHYATGTSGLLQVIVSHDPSFAQYQRDAGLLDQFYTPTRYPDALPGTAAPYEVYSPGQAQEVLEKARRIVQHVRQIIGDI